MQKPYILACIVFPSCLHRPLKAQLAAELASCATDEESAEVRARFEAAERDLEHSIGECRNIPNSIIKYHAMTFIHMSNVAMHSNLCTYPTL